jgi:hypothetical protein
MSSDVYGVLTMDRMRVMEAMGVMRVTILANS